MKMSKAIINGLFFFHFLFASTIGINKGFKENSAKFTSLEQMLTFTRRVLELAHLLNEISMSNNR